MNRTPADPTALPPKDAIVPLSGNPFFTCIISKSHLPSPCQVSIPTAFHQYLPSEYLPVVLSCRNKLWKMVYCGNRPIRRLYCGWEKFATDNKLKIGDGCVFELVDSKNLQFKVQILPGQLPSKSKPTILPGQLPSKSKPTIAGDSTDSPIFIN